MMKSTLDNSPSSRTILFTNRSNTNYSTRIIINKTIHNTNENNIQITNTNKIKYTYNDLQDSIQSTNQCAPRSVPNKIQWISSDDSSISCITLPSFQKKENNNKQSRTILTKIQTKEKKTKQQPKLNTNYSNQKEIKHT